MDTSITKKLFYTSLPIILVNALEFLFVMMDSFLVAGLGESAISVVEISSQIYFCLNYIVLGVVSSNNMFLSRFNFEKRYENEICLVIGYSLKIIIGISLFFSVVAVAKALGAYQDYIYYGDEDENTFDIKFNEMADRLKFSFIECKALWFWPTIAANGIVYPCAHKANEDNTYLGICLENLENYYEWIEEHIKVWKIKCDTPHLCPSNLNYLNSKFIGV